MASDNPFDDAMDEAESEQTGGGHDEDDLDEFLEAMANDTKTETIGIGVSPQMMRLWRQLREDDSVDVDPAEDFRDHLMKLARRHEDVARAAKQIYDIQNK